MSDTTLFYDHSSPAIAVVLFLLITLAVELGYRIGRFVQARTDDEVRALTGAIQGSILGLLALLLGFAFSMSMQRYDSRNLALINEANAIGTATLRVELLPRESRAEAAALLDDYVELRIAAGQVDMTRDADRRAYLERTSALQARLWAVAMDATQADPRPVTTGAFVTSLNDMFDRQGERSALLQLHVPEVVMVLLFVVFIAAGGILGYSSGLGGRRVTTPTLLVALLIVLIVFIIIDLDRPKRGLIKVSQRPLLELRDGASGGR